MAGTKRFDEFASTLNFYNMDNNQAQEGPKAEGLGGSGFFAKLSQSIPNTVVSSLSDVGLASVASVTQTGFQAAVSATGRAKTMARSATTSISEITISRQTWMYFFGCASLGIALIGLSFMFLPMIVLFPQKFALLFTLGSLSLLTSLSILRGHTAFIKHLMSWNRVPFSSTYILSMLGTLWASLVRRSYLLTIAFSSVQVCALAYFLVSYIPGGKRALTMSFNMCWRVSKGCVLCRKGGHLLPF